MKAVNQRGKKERGVGWEVTLNQGEPPHSLTLVMYVANYICIVITVSNLLPIF